MLLGENLAINSVVFTLFIYKKNTKNGSLFNDYVHCDLVGKMCITNGKTACQVHNYMLLFSLLLLPEKFQFLKSHCMISVKVLPYTLYGGEEGTA